MRKTLSAFVVVLALLAGVAPVQAQGILRGGYMPDSPEGWYYYIIGDQVHMLQADNIEYVRRTMNIGRRAQMRRVTDDLVGYGDQVGLNGPQGFYPLYQCGKGQRIGRYAVDIGVGTLLGAVIDGKRGAAIGGGLGAAVAVREDLKCWSVQNKMVVIDDPSDVLSESAPQVRPTQGRENGWNPILRYQANSGGLLFGSYRGCLEQGLATLKNEGRNPIQVYQNGTSYVDLLPRQSECGDPRASYEAEVLSMVVDGFSGTAESVRRRPEGRDGLVLVWR